MSLSIAFLVDSVPFTKPVIAGETSLGGSESACLGLARALKARGHDVHIFTTRLGEDAHGPDYAGVLWHAMAEFQTMNQFLEWDVVVSLRMFTAFAFSIYARLRVLWSEDLLVPGQMQDGIMAVSWNLDTIAYVSDYHRRQWEDLQPELKPLAYVTRNGYDPAHVPSSSTKDPNRIIHISRPERGLRPLLAMWPALKAKYPQATLQVCRYSSMYDQGPGSWSDTCAAYDRQLEAVNAQVGGITYLGELTKPQLYKAISEAAVMWYPGVASFAETSCIAAIEAQACGTPFVGSYKGALPETCPSGLLFTGDADADAAYQQASIAAVGDLLDGCARQSFQYRRLVREGLQYAQPYAYATIAEEWEEWIESTFSQRYEANKRGVLRQLLHEDDHTAARIVAHDLDDQAAVDFCDYVIAGKDQSAEHYGNAAVQDPMKEVQFSDRFKAVIPRFEGCTRVLDVACGNGSFALALTLANPDVHVHGFDYSEHNIEIADAAAKKHGVGDRCHFARRTVYDFDTQQMHAEWKAAARLYGAVAFDGLFCGEFVEHVGNCTLLIDSLEAVLAYGATVVYTCPQGACAELLPRNIPLRRGHVHRFHYDDLFAVWGPKLNAYIDYLAGGVTERGNTLGNWIITYTVAPDRPAGQRPYAQRIRRTRPMPKLSVGMIVKDAENDLARCLSSLYKLADEIVIGDTGSTDTTKQIAADFKATVIDLPPVMDTLEGFAGARNAVLAQCTGDWHLWVDADEQIIGGPWLRRYMDGHVFNGYVLHQTHLYMDGPPTFDIPVRLFRNTGQVKFFGCVHEQPQDGDANADIYPTLDLSDVSIAHTGYLTQDIREDKRVSRNLPLLIRDQQVFPERLLGQVLLLREAVIQADMIRANHRGQVTPKAQQGYAHAIRIFLEHFDDPGHKYAKLARPWYEVALKHLGMGWEHEVAMAGAQGGLGGRQAKPERIWVRDAAEFERVMAHRTKKVVEGMAPVTFKTDPDVGLVVEPESATA